jgi:hypothetical protein
MPRGQHAQIIFGRNCLAAFWSFVRLMRPSIIGTFICSIAAGGAFSAASHRDEPVQGNPRLVRERMSVFASLCPY